MLLPHNYKPRPYQIPLLRAMDCGINRAVIVIHRRAGKDKTLINLVAKKMFERVGSYYYFFPTYKQGKKIIWNGMDKNGFKFISHIPENLRKRTDNSEMLIETTNHSIFQVIGTDNIDSIVGTNPIGCIFSEYSLQNPIAWDLMRPVLRENGGWAVFNFTPRGNNHAKRLFDMAKNNEKWFCQLLTVDDTHDESGNRIITDDDIEEERRSGMSEELIQQEYYCSFNAAIQGAYYTKELEQAQKERRLTNAPYEPQLLTHTVWDIGVSDATVILFIQVCNREIRIIDYYENNNFGLDHYIKIIKEKPYIYGKHFAPHDIKAKEWSNGKSRQEIASGLGINFELCPRLTILDGIDAVRRMFPRVWIDSIKCERLIDCLTEYKREYDEDLKDFKNSPLHDWSSHAADGFRYLALSVDRMNNERVIEKNNDDWFNKALNKSKLNNGRYKK
jgi:phage terminase large subunit